MTRFGVVVFPGSNCDHDTYHVLKHVLEQQTEFLWHNERDLKDSDVVVLPGGFAYGDYLRTGAIAKFAPIMQAVRRHAAEGGLVLGICNGFQVLQEAGLLPGAMLRNKGLKFVCKFVDIRVESSRTPFTNQCQRGQVLSIPIAHNEGNFYADPRTLGELQDQGQIIFRYCDNPNGAVDDIAGVCNREGNVLGLMPHPERASDAALGSADGLLIFRSLIFAAAVLPA
ncbi:MAG: phosphoribosylformylglycinamidine synthase subunit PurQ [Acidobacteria bacterium]|nr:phosphoribosylformylglycinamidine synthase subunit PurQ [Acidobacteriota bacterium]